VADELRHGRVLRILRMVFGSSRLIPSRARRQFEHVRPRGFLEREENFEDDSLVRTWPTSRD
jgi:hypothetical protein